ncbi:MAG: hypothetical protein HYY32_01235 [Chloroflexi bacterium]|nr:hypothetical protein [Chloroflexota bacterium]
MNRRAPPRLLLWALPSIDAFIRRFLGIRPLAGGGVFRINYHYYRGRPFTLPDGTTISRGQRLAEIHLDNQRLSTGQGDIFDVTRQAKADLRLLVRRMESDSASRQIKAVHGVTVHHKAAARLGFSPRDLHSRPLSWLTNLFLRGLLVRYHPRGRLRLQEGRNKLEAKEIWMSAGEMVRRYR